MIGVNVITLFILEAMCVCFALFVMKGRIDDTMGVKYKGNWISLSVLLLFGLAVRIILAMIEPGYEVDMGCFTGWANIVYEKGFAAFYTSDGFADYPPGYIYILWVCGAIMHGLPSLAGSHLLVKMPAILCDLATTAIIYKLAHKKFNELASVLLATFYMLNPVVLIDSAMWGQVDAVFTLCIVIMIYLVVEKKLIPAYYVFALGILIKPQALILTPVLGLGVLDQVYLHKGVNWKSNLKRFGAVLGIFAVAAVAIGVSGKLDKPDTVGWESSREGEYTVFDFSNNTNGVSKVAYVDDVDDCKMFLEESADGVNWTPVVVDGDEEYAGRFFFFSKSWGTLEFTSTQPYLRMTTRSSETKVKELIFFDQDEEMVNPSAVSFYVYNENGELVLNEGATFAALFDETDLYQNQGFLHLFDICSPQYIWLLIPFLGYMILYLIFADFKSEKTRMASFKAEKSFVSFLKVDLYQVLYHLLHIYLAIAALVVSVMPYGLFPVWKQYNSTLVSYKYATVNAYNFWEMFKLNWVSQDNIGFLGLPYKTWGSIFIFLIVAVVLVASLLNCHKENGAKYFFYGAFITAGFFMFSVRVHERYMFPVFALLLLAYLYKPRVEYFIAYLSLAFVQVNNIWDAFKNYNPSEFDWEATFPRNIAILHFCVFCYVAYILVRFYFVQFCKEEELEPKKEALEERMQKSDKGEVFVVTEASAYWEPKASVKKKKFNKFDWIALLTITAVYAVIALTNLGNKDAPQTYWETGEWAQDTCLTFDFSGAEAYTTKMAFFNGNYEEKQFYLEESADGVNWTGVPVNEHSSDLGEDASIFKIGSVFSWGSITYNQTQPWLRMRLISDRITINELVFFDASGNKVVPNNNAEYANAFDENEKYPEISTFRDSTYFDEIYHGRTGYEMVKGIYNYEWTHPPLGKFFISLGIRAYGMCPFGWRISGTLFGIAMLPIFYLFTRRMFGETFFAALATTLFAADFMHFTQTRIATIDVYVTFFIILMYYFMFKYYQMSFYDTDVRKTFVPLLCSGISMGLGCACKWPGVYAGAGLGVIFFIVMFRRAMEYRYAWNDPTGSSNGISHEHIIGVFKKNTFVTIVFCVLAFVLIPGTIYTLSYIPFNNGNDMGIIARMLKNQIDMWNYHSKLDATHPFSSMWYEWIVIKRPIWYYTQTVGEGIQENISAMGNPLVWWLGVPAFVYMIYRSIQHKDRPALFLCLAYLAQLLPWVGVSRCTFIYHYFPSVPFIAIMIGYTMYQWFNGFARNKTSKLIWKSSFIAYVALAVLLFAMFYPVISGYPVNTSYVARFLKWFDSWVLASV